MCKLKSCDKYFERKCVSVDVYRNIFLKYVFFSVKYHPYAPYFSTDTHLRSKYLSQDLSLHIHYPRCVNRKWLTHFPKLNMYLYLITTRSIIFNIFQIFMPNFFIAIFLLNYNSFNQLKIIH